MQAERRADLAYVAGLILKPQLFVFSSLRLLMLRRVAVVAIAAGAAVVAVSTALFPHWIAVCSVASGRSGLSGAPRCRWR